MADFTENSEQLALEVTIRPRVNGRPICSGCGKVRPDYDQAEPRRRFEFMSLWMIPVVFLYRMRRVNCLECGVKVERVPWAEGKSSMTIAYKWFLARWARRMCWKDVSETFHVSWNHVYNAVNAVLDRFHIVQRLNKALDKVRTAEIKNNCVRMATNRPSKTLAGFC